MTLHQIRMTVSKGRLLVEISLCDILTSLFAVVRLLVEFGSILFSSESAKNKVQFLAAAVYD